MKKIFFILVTLFNTALAQQYEKLVVHFDFDKAELSEEAKTDIDSLFSRLQGKEIISLSVTGHCDSKGSNAYNYALSKQRVLAVTGYVHSKHHFTGTMVTNAYGEDKLLNEDVTEDDSRANRRVEIIVTIKTPRLITGIDKADNETESKSLTTMLEDTTLKKGDIVRIPNLEFYNHSDILLPKSMPTLQELLSVLQKNPAMKISIEGHICCTPYNNNLPLEQQANYAISVIRAKMIYDYLIKNNISAERISYKAFGNSKPIYPYPEQSEEERNANRRVEIRIIEK